MELFEWCRRYYKKYEAEGLVAPFPIPPPSPDKVKGICLTCKKCEKCEKEKFKNVKLKLKYVKTC